MGGGSRKTQRVPAHGSRCGSSRQTAGAQEGNEQLLDTAQTSVRDWQSPFGAHPWKARGRGGFYLQEGPQVLRVKTRQTFPPAYSSGRAKGVAPIYAQSPLSFLQGWPPEETAPQSPDWQVLSEGASPGKGKPNPVGSDFPCPLAGQNQ